MLLAGDLRDVVRGYPVRVREAQPELPSEPVKFDSMMDGGSSPSHAEVLAAAALISRVR